ncbi:Hypothetical protein CINCED_3A010097 [Cinara cedri]|uniref:Uncharacterized protein n=1 Tax=Cinara cedri TaxID=506608 RepID=A0A5E4MXW3_9HEMI|nr:Hypothetical protein CINCED_3A010097 [Cinara cedri]
MTRPGHSYDDIEMTKNIFTLNTIVQMQSWRWNPSNMDSLAHQVIFFENKLCRFVELNGVSSKITEDNWQEMSSMMYLALGCKCGETIRDIMSSLLTIFSDHHFGSLEQDLININRVILKTLAALLDFADKAPNVLSLGSTMLIKMSLKFNLHINFMLMRIKEKSILLDFQLLLDCKKIIFQIINLVERFIISNCFVKVLKPTEMNNVVNKTIRFDREQICNITSRFEYLLNNSGLSTTHYFKYNINNWSWLENQNKLYESLLNETNSKNVIEEVSSYLNTILGINAFDPKLAGLDNMTNILSYRNKIFDLITYIIYRKTNNYLEWSKKNIPQITGQTGSKFDSEQSISQKKIKYFDEFYIKDRKLIRIYKELRIKSELQNFPVNIVNHISTIEIIITDVIRFGEYQNLNCFVEKMEHFFRDVKKSEIFSQNNLSDFLSEDPVFIKKKDYELHNFLHEILTERSFGYFNQIFNLLLANDFPENNGMFAKHNHDLNIIDIDTSVISGQMSNDNNHILSLYAKCLDVQLQISIYSMTENRFEVFQKRFSLISKMLNQIIKTEKMRQGNRYIHLLYYARDYYTLNIITWMNCINDINTPVDKINRIMYYVTNLVDKYQIYNYASPDYRDSVYMDFINDPVKMQNNLNADPIESHGDSTYTMYNRLDKDSDESFHDINEFIPDDPNDAEDIN